MLSRPLFNPSNPHAVCKWRPPLSAGWLTSSNLPLILHTLLLPTERALLSTEGGVAVCVPAAVTSAGLTLFRAPGV